MAATPFRPALDLMSQYAEYHRDKRNIATHFVGIPLIVFAIGILLARARASAASRWHGSSGRWPPRGTSPAATWCSASPPASSTRC